MPANLKEIAIAAKNHARQFIQKGNTELVKKSNLLDKTFYRIAEGIQALREQYDAIDKNAIERIDPDTLVFEFTSKIEIMKKYSLGNCGELADLALDYILDNHPDIYAACSTLKTGDHVVLYLSGKPQEEKGDDPDNQIICDPWSDLVCTVSEAKAGQLKSYKMTSLLGFSRHYLVELPQGTIINLLDFNTEKLGIRNTEAYQTQMQIIHLHKLSIILYALVEFNRTVEDVKLSLEEKPVNSQDKITLLKSRSCAIKEVIVEITHKIAEPITPTTYKVLREHLQNSLLQTVNKATALAQFSQNEIAILTPTKPDDTQETQSDTLLEKPAYVLEIERALTQLNTQFLELKDIPGLSAIPALQLRPK